MENPQIKPGMDGESRHSISERVVLIGLGSASQEERSFV